MLSACVPSVELGSAIQQENTAHTCCADLAQLPFEDLDLGSFATPVIDASTSAFSFPMDGVSYFKAYKIPPSEQTIRIVIRAYVFADGYPAKRMVAFAPKVLLLDRNKHIIAATTYEHIKFVSSDIADEPSKPAKLEVDLDVVASDTARYFVVFTPQKYVGSELKFIIPEPGPTYRMGNSYVSAGPGLEAVFITGAPVAPRGSLSVTLRATQN